jgi:hypothetical protein
MPERPVLAAHRLSDGLRLAGHPDLSAAVVDFGLSDGEGTALCERLKERGIPFVLHSGYHHAGEACPADVLVAKTCGPPTARLCRSRPTRLALGTPVNAATAPHRT